MLSGRLHPEFGGAPDVLDVVGVNNYSFRKIEYREQGPHQGLPPDDDRIVPLCELLQRVWERYNRPMITSETSGLGGTAALRGSRTGWRSAWPPCHRG